MVGNLPNFNNYDVLRCFLRITKNVPRIALTSDLQLGEGTVRTILDILKSKKLIDSTRQGHFLTRKGQLIRRQIKGVVEYAPLVSQNMFSNKQKMAFLVKQEKEVKVGYAQRDVALKSGAEAALLFIYNKGLRMLELDHFDTKSLENLFDFKKNNILLVTVAESMDNAERAGFAVAAELSPELRKVVNSFC